MRYIVEKQIGIIKNYRSLDNIRNTQAGHIQIDYRIACAMINYQHKPCSSVEGRAVDLAKKIREKSTINTNNLLFLLNKRLDTKLMIPVQLETVCDFPRLNEDDIKNDILYGSFQLKQSKSYVIDLVLNGRAYVASNNLIKQMTNKQLKKDLIEKKTKIVAVEITSRHKRSEKKTNKTVKINQDNLKIKKFKTIYKVFVHYLPNINSSTSIIGNIYFLNFL